jgi:hypothetical protein
MRPGAKNQASQALGFLLTRGTDSSQQKMMVIEFCNGRSVVCSLSKTSSGPLVFELKPSKIRDVSSLSCARLKKSIKRGIAR